QAQAVVLVGFPDPLHAQTADHRDGSRVRRPYDRNDLLDALLECPPRQLPADLGRVAVAPRMWPKLPADRVLVVGWQRQEGRSADQAAVLPQLDGPPPGRRCRTGILSDPLLQYQSHRGLVGNPVHGRNQPACDLLVAVRAEGGSGVVSGPWPQQQTLGHKFLGHRLTIARTTERPADPPSRRAHPCASMTLDSMP